MMSCKRILIGALLCCSVALGQDWDQWKLQYSQPAAKWTEALPKACPTDSVSGLKAKGDVTVSINWKTGKLVTAHLTASPDRSVSVRYQGQIKNIDLVTGQPVKVTFP